MRHAARASVCRRLVLGPVHPFLLSPPTQVFLQWVTDLVDRRNVEATKQQLSMLRHRPDIPLADEADFMTTLAAAVARLAKVGAAWEGRGTAKTVSPC